MFCCCLSFFIFLVIFVRLIISISTGPAFTKFPGMVELYYAYVFMCKNDDDDEHWQYDKKLVFWYLEGCCHGNQFFIQPKQFFHNVWSKWPMWNKLCAVIHDALEVDRRRFLLTTPVHRGTDIAFHGNRHFSPGHFPSDISSTLACDGTRQEVQVLHWTHAN